MLQANIAGAKAMLRALDERMAVFSALIEQHDVDVVILQAALDANGEPTPIELILGSASTYHVVSHGSLAILSRVPIVEDEAVALTGLGLADDPTERHLLLARLPDHDLTIAVAHVSWVSEQAERNVGEAIGVLGARGDTLLVGDFNQPPESAAVRALTGAGFVDAWARLRPGEDGFSYETGKLDARIDYVFERAATPLVTRIDLVAAGPDESLSDHAFLLFEVAR